MGAGPAGLTAAFYLRKKGHAVTIFEARSRAGGMLRYGIPRYRLPEDVLDKEINQLLAVGIELKTDCKLGVDFRIEGLREDGFEAIFLGVGAQLSRRIDLEGSDLEPVEWGVEFLTKVADGRPPAVKEKVVVIGGGNVAVDVALTALRLGAKKVSLACLEKREEMPANPWEIEQALVEGVEMLYSWGPRRVIGNDGKVAGIELVRCTSVFNETGNFCPYFDDTRITIEADQIILAVGQDSETAFCRDFCFLDEQSELPVQKGLIAIDPETQQTRGARGVCRRGRRQRTGHGDSGHRGRPSGGHFDRSLSGRKRNYRSGKGEGGRRACPPKLQRRREGGRPEAAKAEVQRRREGGRRKQKGGRWKND